MAHIEFRQITKDYIHHQVATQVLRGVSGSIEAGSNLVIRGPSGVGKSTLLHIIGALEEPTSGEVIIGGVNLWKQTNDQRCHFRNHRLGFIFQFHHLLPDFSALENVMIPLQLRGIASGEAKGEALKALERVGLGSRTHHRPVDLSGGEQQRVAVARAIVGRPDLILADEPSGNLDGETGSKIFDLLFALNKELKSTLVVVTHNENLIPRFQTSRYLLNGRFQE